MTDGEMAEFIMPDVDRETALIAVRGLPPEKRALFERMANLSRGGRSKDEDDNEDEDDGDGPSISIPRFLGRQNNQ